MSPCNVFVLICVYAARRTNTRSFYTCTYAIIIICFTHTRLPERTVRDAASDGFIVLQRLGGDGGGDDDNHHHTENGRSDGGSGIGRRHAKPGRSRSPAAETVRERDRNRKSNLRFAVYHC